MQLAADNSSQRFASGLRAHRQIGNTEQLRPLNGSAQSRCALRNKVKEQQVAEVVLIRLFNLFPAAPLTAAGKNYRLNFLHGVGLELICRIVLDRGLPVPTVVFPVLRPRNDFA